MNWIQLMNMSQPDISAKFPMTRRFFAQGFKVSPRFHADDVVGLESLNQTLQLNVRTGEFASV